MNNQDHASNETLADHAEGLLGESKAGLVTTHLAACADCRSTTLLLVSLRQILEADDPGPMPARYAARIDATLAELAIAAPVLPAPAGTVRRPTADGGRGGGAEVADLATRRTVMVGALRRLGTVAAGVVLLIGGAALGVQLIGDQGRAEPRSAIGPRPRSEPPTVLFAVFPTPPPDSIDGPHGTKQGPDGTLYGPDKVHLPGGELILRPTTPGGPPVVIRPVHKPATAPAPKASKAAEPPPKPTTPQTPATVPGVTDPATAPAPTIATPPPPVATTSAERPVGSPAPAAPGDGRVRIAARSPYVSQSGTAYTEDNFAAKVMDLLVDAAADRRPVMSGGAQSSSTNQAVQTDPQDDPAAPPVRPSAAARRGSTAADVKARVLRCASEIPGQAIAGDDGTWLDRPATIVVVPSDHPDQVVGYVFYGDCTKSGPVTPSDYQWRQQVNNPAAPPTRRTTPPRRVGDITRSGRSLENTVPAGGAAPTSSPSPASTKPDPTVK